MGRRELSWEGCRGYKFSKVFVSLPVSAMVFPQRDTNRERPVPVAPMALLIGWAREHGEFANFYNYNLSAVSVQRPSESHPVAGYKRARRTA
eukprot:1348120-Amorphochlora_amoeboformis.AAC.1